MAAQGLDDYGSEAIYSVRASVGLSESSTISRPRYRVRQLIHIWRLDSTITSAPNPPINRPQGELYSSLFQPYQYVAGIASSAVKMRQAET